MKNIYPLFKMFFVGLFLAISFLPQKSFAANKKERREKIIKVVSGAELSLAELAENLKNFQVIILGEEHYSLSIQRAQSKVIKKIVLTSGMDNNFTVAWEFLDAKDKKLIEREFFSLKTGKIDSFDFLEKFFYDDYSLTYAPIIEVTKNLGGRILGVNLLRKEKCSISQGGITAADPKIIPPDFKIGSKRYFKRFKEAAGRHHGSNNDALNNLFDAQCLTDELMARNLMKDDSLLKFLVVGSFHSDFYDGVADRIMAISNGVNVATVRFVDISKYTDEEVKDTVYDLEYGNIADYVYFVGESRKKDADNQDKKTANSK